MTFAAVQKYESTCYKSKILILQAQNVCVFRTESYGIWY